MKKVRSPLNLDLNLPHSLWPCWTALSILWDSSSVVPQQFFRNLLTE